MFKYTRMFPAAVMMHIPTVDWFASLSRTPHGNIKLDEGRYPEGIKTPNSKLIEDVAAPVTGGNVSVTRLPTRVNFQDTAVVIAPVQAVDAAVISSYQFSNWLVMPAAPVLAVKLMPLAAVPWIRLPPVKVVVPSP